MKLNELKAVEGSRKQGYRVGRGLGSGNGKTCGKGQKGQNSRSGGGVALGFEGGQLPLYRRLPKRGFNNISRKEYAVVNISVFDRFEAGTLITPALLVENGLIRDDFLGVKVLGAGKLEKAYTVQADKFSQSAKEAIEKAGGKVEVL